MKYRATKKVMGSYEQIIGIGAGDMQNLLKYQAPIAYSVRSEGWACDYYDIEGVLISSGYDFLHSKKTYSNYKMIHDYDEKAWLIIADNNIKYDDQVKAVNELLKDFIKEATTKPVKGSVK